MKKHPRRSPHMRPFTRAIARSVIGAMLLVSLLALAAPAQASTTALIDAEIRSVRLMGTGSVRVEVTYRCDERYGYSPPRIFLHLEPDRYAAAWAGDGAICDGTVQTLVRRLKPLEGQQIGHRIVIYVDVAVADSPSDPHPGGLWAGSSDTYSVETDGSVSRLTDLRLQQTRVNDRGYLVVGIWYECPPGNYVDVEDDSDWADVVVYQWDGQDQPYEGWQPLGDDVICDGSGHRVVKRFPPVSSEGPLDPRLPVIVNTQITTRGPTGGAFAWDAQTSWPH